MKTQSLPVIQVNDHQLSAKVFGERLARSLRNFDALGAKDPNNVARAKEEILKQFVLESMMQDFSNANGIKVTKEALDAEVNTIRSSYPDDLSFRKMLAEEGLSLAEWREKMGQTLLERKVFETFQSQVPAPTSDQIRRYYDENKDRFRLKERIYLRQIVVDDLTKAQSLKDELKKADFQALAKKFSVAPEAQRGGLVGWVEKGSVDIFDKAFSLPIGGTSQVLESPYGFHIFRVEKKMPPGLSPLEEVSALIGRELRGRKEQAEFSKWMDAQIRSSRVLRDEPLIRSIVVETRVR